MAVKPLLILDVDGAVLPLPCGRRLDEPAPPGFRNARASGFPVWVPEVLDNELPGLANDFDLAWCTTWYEDANREVGPLFALPELPVLKAPASGRRWWKHDAVAKYAGQRPLVWADDDMTSSARRWAGGRSAPTLLLRPRPDEGISARHVARIRRFHEGLK